MPDIDLAIFGQRVQEVRENIFNFTQQEFAEKVGSNQVLLSRLERGLGGNINLIFDILNFIYHKGYNAALIFDQSFNIVSFSERQKSNGHNNDSSLSKIKIATQSYYEEILKIVNSKNQ